MIATSTQKAARAFGWGGSLVFALLLVGVGLVLGTDDDGGSMWRVAASAFSVALVGLSVVVYGLVQVARARREGDHERRPM